MEIKSLSYSTLLHQLSYSSSVIDKGQYIVVSTPDLPQYFWGNFLMFPNPPEEGDLDNWEHIFNTEFSESDCTHKAFAWDSLAGEAGQIEAFEEAGYYFEYDDIMKSNSATRPINYNHDIVIKPLESDEDWKKRADLNLACSDVLNLNQLMDLGVHYRTDTLELRGLFLGAFIDSSLVGEMALFRGGQDYGLISMVKTDPNYRKLGICRTLLFNIMMIGKQLFPFKEFVLVADQNSSAGSIYRSVGFEVVEQGASLIKRVTS